MRGEAPDNLPVAADDTLLVEPSEDQASIETMRPLVRTIVELIFEHLEERGLVPLPRAREK